MVKKKKKIKKNNSPTKARNKKLKKPENDSLDKELVIDSGEETVDKELVIDLGEETIEVPEFSKKDLPTKKKSSKKLKQEKEEITEWSMDEMKQEIDETRKDDKQIEKELNEIYGVEDGTMPDMKSFEEKKRSPWLMASFVLIISCLVLGLVAWLGFFVFQPQTRFSEEDVILTVSGEEEITSGQEVTYRIRYNNDQNVPLAKVLLQIRYPEGFVFDRAEPEPTGDGNDEWTLGSLEEHASGYIDIFGKMYGSLEEKQSFRAFLNYIPSNFSSEFQKVNTLSVLVQDSPVIMTIDSPKEVSIGTESEFVIKLENKGTSSTENLALLIEPGEGFSIKSGEPRADDENQYKWTIDEIEDTQEIKITGVFGETVGDSDKGAITFKLLSWKDSDMDGDGYVIQEILQEVDISRTEVSVGMVINGTISDFSVQPGDVLNVSLVIRNNGGEPIKNIKARTILDGPSSDSKSILNWAEITDEADGWVVGEQLSSKIRRGTIEWTGSKVPKLYQLNPGDEVIIDFSLPVKDSEIIHLIDFTNYEITASVVLDYFKGDEEKELSGDEMKILINSDASIAVQDEIDGVGSGTEKHNITWIVENTFHELKDIRVEADLFGDVEFLEDSTILPAGKVEYDEAKKKIVWVVDSMPTSLDILALQMVLSLVPNPSQTNLTSKVRFTATDVITGETITLVGDEVLLNGE
ncbi:hypothetical protein KJ641_01165 [Patescibacteria group bacterium]|nr:hypothetical protein [Patescibacteria group bacterium]MBU1895463.1 hypothetical protein [Patescibacteria group bacterium]